MKVLIQEIMSEYNVPIHKIIGSLSMNPIADNFISVFFQHSKNTFYYYYFDKEFINVINGSKESLVNDLRISINRNAYIFSSKKKISLSWIQLNDYKYYYLNFFLSSPYPYSHILDEYQVIYDGLKAVVNDIKEHIFDKERQDRFKFLKDIHLKPTITPAIDEILKKHYKLIQSTLFQKDFKERTFLPEINL